MGQQTEIILGSTHLSASTFVWPLYRGTKPQPVTIDVGIEVANKIIAELASGGAGASGGGGAAFTGGITTLTIKGKSTSGVDGGSADVVIQNVIVERIVKLNQVRARIVLTDIRLLLSQFVYDMNFNIEFGDGFVEGTEAKKYKDALNLSIESIKPLKKYFDKIERGVGERNLPNKRVLAGLMAAGGLKSLLTRMNADLTVTKEGKFRFVSREDNRSVIPSVTAFKWIEQPGFLTESIFLSNRPRRIRTYYHERHCIRINTEDEKSTDEPSGPKELRIELQQVYASEGHFFTLEELLEEYGEPANAINDREISQKITSGTFEGTKIELDGTVERDSIAAAIKDGWRVLWRIVFLNDKGHLGGWTDWKFGKIKPDGSTSEVTVDCKYVEMLTKARPDPGQGKSTLIDVPMTQNYDGPSPFIAGWEQDAAAGIIRFKAKKKVTMGAIFPGHLREPLRIKKKSTIEGWGAQEILKNFDMTEKEPLSKAKFIPTFKASVYLTATRRAPNNTSMWYPIDAKAFSDGDIPLQELPPTTDLYMIRDYVDDTDQDHKPENDGLGPLLNEDEVYEDGQLRAEIWRQDKLSPINGEGIASTLEAFKATEITGPISRIELMIEGGVAVRTKIITGVTQDAEANKETAMKRLASLKLWTAGAPELI